MESNTLTVEETIALLPESDTIHTFLNPGGTLFGADWTRENVEKAITKAGGARETVGMAKGMGHGIVIIQDDDRPLFIQTRKENASVT